MLTVRAHATLEGETQLRDPVQRASVKDRQYQRQYQTRQLIVQQLMVYEVEVCA